MSQATDSPLADVNGNEHLKPIEFEAEVSQDAIKSKFLFRHCQKLAWWPEFQRRFRVLWGADRLSLLGTVEHLTEAIQLVDTHLDPLVTERFTVDGDNLLQVFSSDQLRQIEDSTTTHIQLDLAYDEHLSLDLCGSDESVAAAKVQLSELLGRKKDLFSEHLGQLDEFEAEELALLAVSLNLKCLLNGNQLSIVGAAHNIDKFTCESFPDFLVWKTRSAGQRLLQERQEEQLKAIQSGPQLPPEWLVEADFVGYKTVLLDRKSDEFKRIKGVMAVQNGGTKIISIERVENPQLYLPYCIRRDSVASRLQKAGFPGDVEKFLFHGTVEANIPSILSEGFNRSLGGTNGVSYGHGCYFSQVFDYSKVFCIGGNKMLYCSVITGRYQVNSDKRVLKVLDVVPGTAEKYDSAVETHPNPSIFVTFHDNSAYPTHLITFA